MLILVRMLMRCWRNSGLQSQIQDFPKEGAPLLSFEVPSQRDSVGGGVVAEIFRGLRKPM